MSDGELRRLERVWRETGAEEDHAALVRARLREGVVTREQVVLAAHYRSSVAAMIERPPVVPPRVRSSHTVYARLNGLLESWALPALKVPGAPLRVSVASIQWAGLRAATAEASRASPDTYSRSFMPELAVVNAIGAAAVAVALEPSSENRLNLLIACATSGDNEEAPLNPSGWYSSLGWARDVAQAVHPTPKKGWFVDLVRHAVTQCGDEVMNYGGYNCQIHHRSWVPANGYDEYGPESPCARCVYELTKSYQSHVHEQLVPWLLGDGDPLRD